MAQIKVKSVTCLNTQDGELGGDEVYFTFHDNGGTSANVTTNIVDINDGETKPITLTTEDFRFTGSASVSLVEDDGPGAAVDDVLASREIQTEAQSIPNAGMEFISPGEGASYVLNYDLIV